MIVSLVQLWSRFAASEDFGAAPIRATEAALGLVRFFRPSAIIEANVQADAPCCADVHRSSCLRLECERRPLGSSSIEAFVDELIEHAAPAPRSS